MTEVSTKICETCKQSYARTPKHTDHRWQRQRFCSNACAIDARKRAWTSRGR